MKKLLPCLVLLLLLTACWDLKEIEEIGFVMAVALDPLNEEERQKYEREYKKETGELPGLLYKTTYQIVIPSALQSMDGTPQGKAFFNISTVGHSNFRMRRAIISRSSRRLNFEHLKAIIINEELLKTGDINKLIDFYFRDHEMRRMARVFISKGIGAEILTHRTPLEILPALSIKSIAENAGAYQAMVSEKSIGELVSNILGQESFVVPRMVTEEGKYFKMAGAAIFSGENNEMIGWLGEIDVEAYNLVIGEAIETIIDAKLNNQSFIYEIDEIRTKISYQQKDEEDYFHIEVKSDGFFAEDLLDNVDPANLSDIKKLEKAVEKKIEELVEKIVEKMQTEFSADIFHFYKKVKQKNYLYWKKIKHEWDGEGGYFSKAKVTVSAEVKIRQYMTIEQTKGS